MAQYQNLITQSMYDKQLDSGKGTLLHLCDDVIQQEVSPSLMHCDSFSFFFFKIKSVLIIIVNDFRMVKKVR